MSANQQRTRLAFLAVLLTCLVVSLISVGYPLYVIRPFRAQGARELADALAVIRWRPAITLISAAAALTVLAGYWRARPRKRYRALAAAGAGLVCALAVFGRVNVYELMFHPIEHPSFSAAPQAKLDKDEKVIAVKIASDARAYPIRVMAYHHILNDVLDRVAIVATY